MQNRNLLIVIIILLVGIAGILVTNQANRPQKPKDIIEHVSNDLSEAAEEVKDEVDDHTTSAR